MSFPRYPKYKTSGVEWLGEVPEHWGVVQYKQFVDIQNGSDHKQIEQSEGYPVFGSGGIFAYASEFLYDGESVLLGRKGTIDKPLYVTGRFWTVDTMYWTKIRANASGRYVFYLAVIIPFDYYSTNTALPSMTKGAFNRHLVTLPPLEEQTAIAAFLDHETAKIDALVAEQERLIELLKEKRQAVISHAVTKGLNPDAPMKDSGIEWLGEVPEHWEVWKLSHAFDVIGSGTTPKSDNATFYDDGETAWVNTGDLNDGDLFDCEKRVTELALAEHSSLKIFPPGSLVIAMYGATIGKLARLQFSATVNQACCVFAGGVQVRSEFLFYWFTGLRQQIISLATGGGQPNISQEILRGLRLACPTHFEQTAIAAFLDHETAKINILTTEANRVIDLLKERRTALISAAVTGQIDVRNLVSVESA